MRKLLIAAASLALISSVAAQEHGAFKPEALKWSDAPAALPKGAQIATIVGDPSKAGQFYIGRLKLPPNYRVPPHTHPYEVNYLTVLSGRFGFGMGEKFDESKGEMFGPGSVIAHTGKPAHYVWTGSEETIIQLQGVGPGVGMEYVNAADDPRKK